MYYYLFEFKNIIKKRWFKKILSVQNLRNLSYYPLRKFNYPLLFFLYKKKISIIILH